MINISIIENDMDFSLKMKQLINRFFSARKIFCNINILKYPIISEDKIDWEYCFLDTEIPDVEYVVNQVKSRYNQTKIVYIGESYNKKNIDMAVKGFELGISGYILKTFTDAEIFNVFSYLFPIDKLYLIKKSSEKNLYRFCSR